MHFAHQAKTLHVGCILFSLLLTGHSAAQGTQDEGLEPEIVPVEFQPLAASTNRLVEAMASIGAPFSKAEKNELDRILENRSSRQIQEWLDRKTILHLTISKKWTLTAKQIPQLIELYQNEHRPLIVKVINRTETTARLDLSSPSAGAVYSGTSLFSLKRQQQTELGKNQNSNDQTDRYLDIDFYRRSPMTKTLSGLKVEYLILLLHSNKAGKLSPKIHFHLANQKFKPERDEPKKAQAGESHPDRLTLDLNLNVLNASLVKFEIHDITQQTTRPIARIEIRDEAGHVYPAQPKRLSPDLFFQPQIYRRSGEFVQLNPGKYLIRFCRGPEYRLLEKEFTVDRSKTNVCRLDLERWIQPDQFGFYSGDHHIHAAGCSHYTSPTQGITPASMYRQITGEGLNVGCVLTWGPCFDFQRTYFAPTAKSFENRETLLKYDIEVSGFGSQALGHVCLLNLKNQTYPGSAGSKTKGWPTWTTPVMRWAKEQGGFTGYAHSASGLSIDPQNASHRLFRSRDTNKDQKLSKTECAKVLLPYSFATIDLNRDQEISRPELIAAHQKAANQLPNFAVPEMNGVGAMEICVAAVDGVCDFISAMDTARIQEWNTWYHLLNCGFPIKVSGETDFPCMSSRRVGKGRVYVNMGRTIPFKESLNFQHWCKNLALGRSYVSDGFAHVPLFKVNGIKPGFGQVNLDKSGEVAVEFNVGFAPQTPIAVAHGTQKLPIDQSKIGDTVELHHPREHDWITGGTRTVELIVNGMPVASKTVPADGKLHAFKVQTTITKSSWIAVRQFPQLHSNPVNVIVNNKPIRASRRSALWCRGMTELVWQNRQRTISPEERPQAAKAFAKTLERLSQIAEESPDPE